MFYFDRKYLYAVLAVMVISSLVSFSSQELIGILLTLPGVLLAMTVHEFSHAKMADHFGDTTARRQGRLTLNPLAHIDPVGIFLLIFAHIGWGKPVEVNYNSITSNKSKEYCEAMISLAGPLSNFVLAIIFTVLYYLLNILAPGFLMTGIGSILMSIIGYTIIVNIGLGVFNLIPLPPLDGEKIFRNIMPDRVKNWFLRNSNLLQIIFLGLWISGALGKITSPIISGIYSLINKLVIMIFSIFI